jgi:hypothetical protein
VAEKVRWEKCSKKHAKNNHEKSQKKCGRKMAVEKVWQKIRGRKSAVETSQQKTCNVEKSWQQHGWGLFMRDMAHIF